MSEIALYMHAGSGNHGCEAIVDSLVRMMPKDTFLLLSNCAAEDEKYMSHEVKERTTILEEQHIADHFVVHAAYYVRRKLTGDRESFLRYRYKPLIGENKPELAVSIGGDNYCYPSMVEDLKLANSMFCHQGTATVLLGCSIEPSILMEATSQFRFHDGDDKGEINLLEDLHRYRRILARESITYEALQRSLGEAYGKEEQKKVVLCPDPAFTLPADEEHLPEGFAKGNTVGINLSPIAGDYASSSDTLFRAYVQLIRHILDTTKMNIALIPHVVWERNDDRIPLQNLMNLFQGTGRVQLVEDAPAEQLKGIIANCRFFVGARTHATIAAYSTLVPTLTIGYSVKSRGIARDLFGSEEKYVLPVQKLEDPKQLIEAWDALFREEDEIRYQLAIVIPKIRVEARKNAEELHQILREL